jgi:hypothetical protein
MILETSVDRLPSSLTPRGGVLYRLRPTHPLGRGAMHPIARLRGRLAVSFLVAGVQPAPRHFVPDNRADAHSGASN